MQYAVENCVLLSCFACKIQVRVVNLKVSQEKCIQLCTRAAQVVVICFNNFVHSLLHITVCVREYLFCAKLLMPQLSICQPMHGKCVLKYTSVRPRTTMQIIDARSYVKPKDL